jgi:hypothetical protein
MGKTIQRRGLGLLGGALAVAVCGLLLVGFGAVACESEPGSGSSAGAGTPGSSAASPPHASPAAVAGQEALSAYLALWDGYVVAARTADADSPLLARHASGAALKQLVDGLERMSRLGIVVKGEPTHDARVTTLVPQNQPTQAKVVDCSAAENWITYTRSGARTGDRAGRHHIEALVVMADGSWKVAELAVQGVGTC